MATSPGQGWLQLGDTFLPLASIRMIQVWRESEKQEQVWHAIVFTNIPDGEGITYRLSLRGDAAERAYRLARRLVRQFSEDEIPNYTIEEFHALGIDTPEFFREPNESDLKTDAERATR